MPIVRLKSHCCRHLGCPARAQDLGVEVPPQPTLPNTKPSRPCTRTHKVNQRVQAVAFETEMPQQACPTRGRLLVLGHAGKHSTLFGAHEASINMGHMFVSPCTDFSKLYTKHDMACCMITNNICKCPTKKAHTRTHL